MWIWSIDYQVGWTDDHAAEQEEADENDAQLKVFGTGHISEREKSSYREEYYHPEILLSDYRVPFKNVGSQDMADGDCLGHQISNAVYSQNQGDRFTGRANSGGYFCHVAIFCQDREIKKFALIILNI